MVNDCHIKSTRRQCDYFFQQIVLQANTWKLYIAGPLWCDRNPLTDGFPSQRASDVESVAISWHHDVHLYEVSFMRNFGEIDSYNETHMVKDIVP